MQEILLNLAALGKTEQQMADICGVHISSITNWKKDNPEFFASLKAAKEIADSEVEKCLLNKALGKIIIKEKHTGVDANGNIIDKEVIKEIAPDNTAMIFWLKNRQPDVWREKRELELSHEGKIKIDDRDKDL
jgi:transcriptional regulator with XRE-family HTH domain